MDLSIILGNLDIYIEGLKNTFILVSVSLFIGLIFAIPLAAILQSTKNIASVITIVDITGAARIVNSRFYSPYEAFLTAAVFYMTITFIIIWLIKKLEFIWFAHLRQE